MMKHMRVLPAAYLLLCGVVFSGQAPAQGTLAQIKVFGPSLAGNLEGDDPERDVFVYLPPGYGDSGKRYPVIYFLHGYAVGAEVYVNGVLHMPDSVNQAMAGGAKHVIIVIPDAFTRYGGSMYSNSPTIGDWESFVARDLVAYIDAHYRTMPKRESRGLSGHSMGGYGTLRIAMKHPDVFGALYAMSSCCLLLEAPGREEVEAEFTRMAQGIETQAGTMANRIQAQAAAWAPNPRNPPYYFDLPFKDGVAQPLIQAKWTANAQLVMVDQYVPILKRYRAIQLDVGDKDQLGETNFQLDVALTRLGVEHGFEVYDGEHGNRVGQRFIEKLLPFFAGRLEVE